MKQSTKDNSNDIDLMSALKQTMELTEQFLNEKKRYKINYDDDFETIFKKNISDRDDSYTKLLNHFVDITKTRNKVKEIHKWIYFWIVMLLVSFFGIMVFMLVRKIELSGDDWIAGLAVAISCLASFSSVIISIPLIITKYLFSTKEDNNIAKIILHTQKHDLSGKRIIETSNNKENSVLGEKETNDNLLIDTINEGVKNLKDNDKYFPDNTQEERKEVRDLNK